MRVKFFSIESSSDSFSKNKKKDFLSLLKYCVIFSSKFVKDLTSLANSALLPLYVESQGSSELKMPLN